jgi:hypothetical protein
VTSRGRAFLRAGIAGAALLALLAVPVGSQIRASGRADELCRDIGGLHVRQPIPADAIFAEVPAVLLAAGDPLLELAPGRLFDDKPVRVWRGSLDQATIPCMQSGECASVLLTRSSRAYLHIAATGRYLISMAPSPYCEQAASPGAIPSELAAAAGHYSSLLRQAPHVCRAGPSASDHLYVISQQALSAANATPGSETLQFRAWRVFREGRADAVIAYNQFGIHGVSGKIEFAMSRATGVPAPEYSANRCRVDTRSRPYLPPNADSHFELDSTYPQGRFVDEGIAP